MNQNSKYFYKINLRLLVILSLMVVSGCQKNHKPKPPLMDWTDVESWGFNGKMAINNGQDNGSGRIQWQQTRNSTTASFKAPLGQGSWTIKQKQNKAELHSSRHGSSYAENAELLIANELGWFFPWDKIQFWLRGHSSETSKLINIIKPTESFEDDGWKITIQQWKSTEIGFLPRKIKAIKPPYSVKVIIYDWELQ